MKKARRCGSEVAASALNLPDPSELANLWERLQSAHFSRDDGEMKDLDLAMKGKTDELMNDIVK